MRVGWRLIGQLLLYLVFALTVSALVFPWIPEGGVYLILEELVVLVVVVGSVYPARRFLDRRSLGSLGIAWKPGSLRQFLVGFFIAGISMSLLFFTFLGMGWLQVDGFVWQNQAWSAILGSLGISLLVHLMVGFSEELMARGYWMQNLAEKLGLPWAAVLSAALFSLLHAGNPGYSWMAFLGLFAGGFDVAYGYARTRSLWLPIGLHMGWNFFEGAVYGFTVSGAQEAGLVLQRVVGPELWTGGGFGPEAGLLMLAAVGVNLILISYLDSIPKNRGS